MYVHNQYYLMDHLLLYGKIITYNITKMVKEVAIKLGNTPAVCRGSYIHPRFINDYLKGSFFRIWKETIGEQMYPLTENESHVIRYLENK